VLTIRKFSPVPLAPRDLVRNGSLGPRMLEFLGACVRARMNLIVSGGTGSGKTTMLGVLSGCIPDDERLITIEARPAPPGGCLERHPRRARRRSNLGLPEP
jgi:pilus assembly protein CpaF